MLIWIVTVLTLASILLAMGIPAVMIADWAARAVTDWCSAKLEARLEAQVRATVLYLPYVSWSDTVTHTVTKMDHE
jgi:hypothetical protein